MTPILSHHHRHFQTRWLSSENRLVFDEKTPPVPAPAPKGDQPVLVPLTPEQQAKAKGAPAAAPGATKEPDFNAATKAFQEKFSKIKKDYGEAGASLYKPAKELLKFRDLQDKYKKETDKAGEKNDEAVKELTASVVALNKRLDDLVTPEKDGEKNKEHVNYETRLIGLIESNPAKWSEFVTAYKANLRAGKKKMSIPEFQKKWVEENLKETVTTTAKTEAPKPATPAAPEVKPASPAPAAAKPATAPADEPVAHKKPRRSKHHPKAAAAAK